MPEFDMPILKEIGLDQIDFYIYNFRDEADSSEDSIVALSENIGEQGQIEPALVIKPFGKSAYEWNLVTGHRRYLAMLGIEERTKEKQTLLCTIRHADNEQQALLWAMSENTSRKAFKLSELCKLEVKIRDMVLSKGLAKTAGGNTKSDLAGYAKYRARIEGVTDKTIYKRLAVGNAVPLLHDAMDAKALTFESASMLAAQEPSIQTHVLKYMSESGNRLRSTTDIKTVVESIKQQQGLPVARKNAKYLPKGYMDTIVENVNNPEKLLELCLMALNYYGKQWHDNGLRARSILEAYRCAEIGNDERLNAIISEHEGDGNDAHAVE